MKATARGMTMGFAAPAQVAGERGQTATLVTALTSEKPVARPSAKDAIKMPFFTILKEVCKKAMRTCLFCESMGDDLVKEQASGIECSEGHFHCGQCVCKLTGDLLKVENSSKRALQ